MAKQDLNLKALAQLFRILGDQSRLRILFALKEGELNVTELCKRLKLRQPTVSHHLGILRMVGIVHNRRNGKEIIYSLRDIDKETYGRLLKAMLKHDKALRLGSFVLSMAD